MDAGILAEIVPAMLKALIAGNPGSELIVFTTIILMGKLYLALSIRIIAGFSPGYY
jgi:hypothetical protein